MSFVDKIIDIMHMGSDDGYDDDYDEDEYEYDAPKKSASIAKPVQGEANESYDSDDDGFSKSKSAKNNRQIRQINTGKRNAQVCTIKAESIDKDGEKITQALVKGFAVILDLEGINYDASVRIFDFTSGATSALGGSISPIGSYAYIAAPKNFNVDKMDELNNI